ncbi:MAG: hypothetical protein ACXIUZ_07290 [Lysobacteraceae bacterium]
MNPQTRSRIALLVILVLFFSSFGVALFLHYSGWEPTATRNYGSFLEPAADLTALPPAHADGEPYPWNPRAGVWRVVAVPHPDCEPSACAAMVDALRRVWISEGRHADKLHVLWFGEVPDDAPLFRNFFPMQPSEAIAAALPEQAGREDMPVYVADPSGYLVLHYPSGFDPSGLSRDLRRLIK